MSAHFLHGHALRAAFLFAACVLLLAGCAGGGGAGSAIGNSSSSSGGKTGYTFAQISIGGRNLGPFYKGFSNSASSGTTRIFLFGNTQPCQNVEVVYTNYYPYPVYPEIARPNPNPLTIKASLELNGVLYPFHFQGQSGSGAIVNGGAYLVSDPLPVQIGTAGTVAIRTYWNAGSGGYIPNDNLSGGDNPGAPPENPDGITYGVDLTGGGAVAPIPRGNGQTWSYGPTAVLCNAAAPAQPSVLIVGDSIAEGTDGDYGLAEPLGATEGTQLGYIARALTAANIGYTDIAMGGSTAANFLSTAYMMLPPVIARAHKYAIVEYGINDLNNGATLAQLQSRVMQIWQYLSNEGLTVYQTTLFPFSSSTDAYATVSNQQPAPWDSIRQGFNSWLRDSTANGAVAQSNGALKGVFDTDSAIEYYSNGWAGVWKAGTLPSSSGNVTAYDGINVITLSGAYAPFDPTISTGASIAVGGAGCQMSASDPIVKDSNNDQVTVSPYANLSGWTDITNCAYAIVPTLTQDGVHPDYNAFSLLAPEIDTAALR